MFVLLALSFTVLPYGWLWVPAIVGIALLPAVFATGWSATQKPAEVSKSQHLNNAIELTYKNLARRCFRWRAFL
jgi:hypothetical protein